MATTRHMRFVIDRIGDDGSAHLEDPDGNPLVVPRTWLPGRAGEGAVLEARSAAVTGELAVLVLTFNEEETRQRRSDAEELRGQLQRGPEGDFDL